MDAATAARYQARIADLTKKRDLLSASIDSALEHAEVQTYSLQDPEGMQSATRRDPEKTMVLLERIDRQIEYYTRLLANSPGYFDPRRW